MHQSEPQALSKEEREALLRIVHDLERAIDMAVLPGFDAVRDLLIRARCEAEAQLGDAPSAALQ